MSNRYLLVETNREFWPGKSQILFYIVRHEKASFTKVNKKNQWVYQLDVGELVGGQILIL